MEEVGTAAHTKGIYNKRIASAFGRLQLLHSHLAFSGCYHK